MKILQINCWYKTGSTGKIVQSIHDYLKMKNEDAYVIYGLGDKASEKNVYRTTNPFIRKIQSFCTRLTGYPYGGCIVGTYFAKKYIEKIDPDLVHIHCINGYMVNIYEILNFIKSKRIPTVLTNHAEFMYTGGCTHTIDCYKWINGCSNCNKIGKEHPISYFFDKTSQEWYKMKESYAGFRNFCVCNVSEWLTERARMSPFYKDYLVMTVNNGIDTDIFHFKKDVNLRNYKFINGRKLVIHVTPGFNSHIKGGKYVIDIARRNPDITFIVVGEYSNKTIVPDNLVFIGRLDDQEELSNLYSISDACLLTSLRETFSMVTAESLCCGTPVVGFKAGGPEAIALPEYSSFVEQGDIDSLEKELRLMLQISHNKDKISEKAIGKFCQNKMCEEYYEIYKKLMNKEDES